MKAARAFLPAAAMLLAALQICRAYEVADASGKVFRFDAPPRAATIVPSVTQNIYAIGAQEYLIGNSKFCNIPDDAKKKAKLGGLVDPDYEKIAALNPEIFILPTLTDNTAKTRLSKLGLPVFTLSGEGLANIAADLRMLGELFQCRERAELQAKKIEDEIAAAPKIGPESKRALFMFGNIAAGKGSYVGELLKLCGLKNSADSSNGPWAVPMREFIFASAPDILFVECANAGEIERLLKYYETDAVWKNTPAVKNKNVFFVPRDVVGVPSVRVIEALRLMRNAIKSAEVPRASR